MSFAKISFHLVDDGRCFRDRPRHAKNAIALGRLRTEFKGKIEKLAVEIVKEESEKTSMARKVHASFTKFPALVGPWDHVAEGAYHQFVAG